MSLTVCPRLGSLGAAGGKGYPLLFVDFAESRTSLEIVDDDQLLPTAGSTASMSDVFLSFLVALSIMSVVVLVAVTAAVRDSRK